MNNRWVTQTKFYDPSKPPEVCTGNCTEAALASLFGIRLDDVPSMQGLIASDYWDALEAFVHSRGYTLSMQPASHRPAGLYLADGPSARGCGHFVVMRDGKMVHDPHPSDAGLLEVEHVWSLMVLDPAALATTGKQQVESIPSGISYAAEHDNFYSHIGLGMGSEFHAKWRNRTDEFPVYRRTENGKQQVGEVQGYGRLLADVDERINTAKALGYEDDIGVGIGLLQCVRAALATRQPGSQEPAFYLTKADADYIAGRNSNANQVVAIREPRSKSAVPFYTAPPAQGSAGGAPWLTSV